MLLFTLPALSFTPDKYNKASHKKIWRNQLQYRKTITGWRSEADEKNFFISENGKHDPTGELIATLKLLQENPEKPWGYIPQPVICAFPTRKKFLEEEFKIKFRKVPCPDFEEWKKAFDKTKLYLMFSAAYPNNPASMFGHTFLLFSKSHPPDSAKGMLDYAINFSADTSAADEKSIFYTIKGLFGGYPARYRIYTFYQMINQYVNWDSRDLWYLELPWKQDKIDRVLEHIWEIFTTTHFNYYFLDENCSYRLLSAMEYADPGLNLVEKFYKRLPLYYTLPIDTYKDVNDHYDGKTEEYYTPSIQKLLKAKIKTLTNEEEKRFHEIRNEISLVTSEKNTNVLDTLIHYYDYQKRVNSELNLPQSVLDNLQLSLRQRAKIREPSPPTPTTEKPASPLRAHDINSLWTGAGAKDGEFLFQLGGKIAAHDLLSPSHGYERWSHMIFFESTVNFTKKETEINYFTLVNLMSFFPVTSYDFKLSWRGEAGHDHHYYGYAKGGAGLSFQSENERNLFYFFASPVISSNGALTNSTGYFMETELGFSSEFNLPFKFWIFYRNLLIEPEWTLKPRNENVNLQMAYHINSSHEIRLAANYFTDRYEALLKWRVNF